MTQWTRVLRKVDDYRWEIPQDYKPGMRVPGLVYADEAMLRQIGQDQALEQVANVATLPGIVRYSLAMPDIHWGYGFPVGGVAALRAEDGVISPGGVGYDINCLPAGTRVLHALGYHRPIEAFVEDWARQQLAVADLRGDSGLHPCPVVGFLVRGGKHRACRLLTEAGREIVATEDHPFLTPDGMVPLGRIQVGERVAVVPFEGVPYEPPDDRVLVDLEDIRRAYPGSATGLRQVLRALQERALLPLRHSDPRLGYLVRLMGYLEGDGHLSFGPGGRASVAFYGRPEDLEGVRADVQVLGFRPSRVYQRRRAHRVRSRYGDYAFTGTEWVVLCRSSALATLLVCLGATAGAKVAAPSELPAWLEESPLWLKRLYLAALFGAELSAPRTVTGHGRTLAGPVLALNKVEEHAQSGLHFLDGVRRWLAEFGVSSRVLSPRPHGVRKDGRGSVRLRLQVDGDPGNLIRLWTRVGFEYNRARQAGASVGAEYLRRKQQAVAVRAAAEARAVQYRGEGVPAAAVVTRLEGVVNRRFVERSLWEGRKTAPRIPADFPTLSAFAAQVTEGLGAGELVWDRVVRKEALEIEGDVYDFTVGDPNHNFVAGGFVVSNCGVRLLRTDLREDEVRPKLRELVEELFRNVPSGVGSTGKVRVSLREVDEVLRGGARWAVERGFGTAADLDTIEATGQLRDADPDAVSPRAKERGKDQIGTLGSGNHFLEVQVVEEVYDPRAAEVMGLFPGQVVVFIHTGSRGLGYQVCEDYLRVADRALKKYGITLPDRQLACAPFSSPEGQEYFRAMCCAANFAWANRQMITHWVRESFTKVLGRPLREIGLQVVYDVAHNIAKLETYPVDGRPVRLVVHRKGATRAFPPGHPEIPARYREIGQPVLIPGDMGRYSFVAVGTERAMEETFGSTCHGAGRVRSRKAAVRELRGVDIAAELEKRGILVRAQNRSLLAEEASEAYKDVADVVEVCHGAGISRKVARMRPIGVVKG